MICGAILMALMMPGKSSRHFLAGICKAVMQLAAPDNG
jgi:hypothetical protein